MPDPHSGPAVDELFGVGSGVVERIQELAKALDSVEAIAQSATNKVRDPAEIFAADKGPGGKVDAERDFHARTTSVIILVQPH